ncbi:MAG: hypothetical protein H0V45_03655 [Actinobacteria bacterium]|nr:hypothetical protein [Actinomycetota bacterium]
MAELTNLEAKLGEVIGLAMAAQASIDRISKLANGEEKSLVKQMKTMRAEAVDAEKRGIQLAGTFNGKKSKIMSEARTVKKKGGEMLKTYLDRDADLLDGMEFMTMAEAGEVCHWAVLAQLNKKAKHPGVRELVAKQLPIQKRHLRDVSAASVSLAAKEDPNAEA